MLSVGLTGGIATGKSYVAELFKLKGCFVLHADRVAHDLIARNGAAYASVVAEFGDGILAADKSIDHAKLAAIVFTDKARLETLNGLVHPHVLAITDHEIEQFGKTDPDGIFISEAALHIEAGYHQQFDKLVVTWCSEEQQIQRLLERPGMTEESARQRVASQMPADQKKDYADYVVDCSGTTESTRMQVKTIATELKGLALKS